VSSRRTVVTIVGTRPNFVKVAPVAAALTAHRDRFRHVLVHTGQHYDPAMSKAFLDDLELQEPHHHLGVGSGSHAQQTALVIERLEPVLLATKPWLVLVPGDVNSTLAAALTASKLGFPLGHVEAGLRSFDRSMPEEINRIVVDQLSDLLFTHSPEAEDNLLAEGRPAEAVHYVGNTMIDMLVAMRERIEQKDAARRHGLGTGEYVLVTLHRPTLVDGELLRGALAALERLSRRLPVVFPMHPRTAAAMRASRLRAPSPRVRLLGPLGYLEFLSLLQTAAAVLTDSGGIQEEATFLGIPCFTLRDNTERPITCTIGTNELLGLDPGRIAEIPTLIESARSRAAQIPPMWDGRAAERIVQVLGRADLRSSDRRKQAAVVA
jgi:UDP-N-acetylglucosamine 2-epimerase (non-hydrolysing)